MGVNGRLGGVYSIHPISAGFAHKVDFAHIRNKMFMVYIRGVVVLSSERANTAVRNGQSPSECATLREQRESAFRRSAAA